MRSDISRPAARRVRRPAALLSIPLLFLSAAPAVAVQYPDDMIWSKAEKPVLQSSREYVLQGRMVNGLCEYTYPDVNLASAEMAWEVHDIAVSPSTCTKVVLEGSPKLSSKSAPSSKTRAVASTDAIERKSRYQ